MAALVPSPDSALIIPVDLPPRLEAMRQAHVPDAASEGIPAHATLLYPFADPASIDRGVLDRIAAIAAHRPSWAMVLAGPGRFPDTLYATVEPDAPIRELQGDLAAAFPALPLYGEPGLRFVPHVTVVEGERAGDPSLAADAAWHDLPVIVPVREVELIVRTAGRWDVLRAFPLGTTLGP